MRLTLNHFSLFLSRGLNVAGGPDWENNGIRGLNGNRMIIWWLIKWQFHSWMYELRSAAWMERLARRIRWKERNCNFSFFFLSLSLTQFWLQTDEYFHPIVIHENGNKIQAFFSGQSARLKSKSHSLCHLFCSVDFRFNARPVFLFIFEVTFLVNFSFHFVSPAVEKWNYTALPVHPSIVNIAIWTNNKMINMQWTQFFFSFWCENCLLVAAVWVA